MKILAIETSCDETAVAIIDKKNSRNFRVLANLVSSQVKIHEKFGGVVPNLARREHEKNLVPILLRALKEANMYHVSRIKYQVSDLKKVNLILEREAILRDQFAQHFLSLKKPKLDAIAVTYGPGLAPALWAGVNFAKALSAFWKVPLIPINHMEGHIFSALFSPKRSTLYAMRFPAIALLVSGGHTELHLVKKLGSYKRLGETLDDASGEAFDKVAKMLGLSYPGGPEISKWAESGNSQAIAFPRPMLKANNFDFSFSGLKTSVLYYLRDHPKYSLADVAASFEEAVVEVLTEKTLRAAKKYKAKTILIGGGVAANKKLRQVLRNKIRELLPHATFLEPQISQTGDNALMIALTAAYGSSKLITSGEHSRISLLVNKKLRATEGIGAEPGLRL